MAARYPLMVDCWRCLVCAHHTTNSRMVFVDSGHGKRWQKCSSNFANAFIPDSYFAQVDLANAQLINCCIPSRASAASLDWGSCNTVSGERKFCRQNLLIGVYLSSLGFPAVVYTTLKNCVGTGTGINLLTTRIRVIRIRSDSH
jgi:hypothetical protein